MLSKEKIQLSPEVTVKLERFTDILHEWNSVHNLTGAKTIEAIYENIIDSLYPISFVDQPKSLLDVGTGAGFPGMILAIVWSDTKCTLCEPINKRASFLKYVAMELEANNITVAKMRVEDLQCDPFDLITSRAVTDTKLLLSLTMHLSNNKTNYLFYKGEMVYKEIDDTSHQLKYDIVSKDKRNYLWIRK